METEKPKIIDRIKRLEGTLEDKLATELRAMRHEGTDDPAMAAFRAELFAELRALIRPAVAQAKKGKPALLRILTRYTR